MDVFAVGFLDDQWTCLQLGFWKITAVGSKSQNITTLDCALKTKQLSASVCCWLLACGHSLV